MTIAFFCPAKADLQLTDEELSTPELLCGLGGRVVWTALTACYLRQQGVDVVLTDTLPDSGVILFHPNDKTALLTQLKSFKNKTFVCVVADASRRYFADFHIFQNPTQVTHDTDYFVNNWPLPGIIPRDEARGTLVENIGFMGRPGNLRQDMREEWGDELKQHGLYWNPVLAKKIVSSDLKSEHAGAAWADYSQTDVVVAIRRHRDDLWSNKPAAKLINAWLGEVPSILGAETAYRHYRRSPLDFIEANSPSEARDALLRLKHNPNLYQDMIENARERKQEFSAQSNADIWTQHIREIASKNHQPSPLGRLCNYLPMSLAYSLRKLQGQLQHYRSEPVKSVAMDVEVQGSASS